MDVLFLETMKLHPTVHVIVMRHPFAWYWPFDTLDAALVEKPTFQPTIWLNVWTHILEQLSNKSIESFAVVNYEALIQNRTKVSEKLANVIQSECLRNDVALDTKQTPPSSATHNLK